MSDERDEEAEPTIPDTGWPGDDSLDREKPGATYLGYREPSGLSSEEWTIELMPKSAMPLDDDAEESGER